MKQKHTAGQWKLYENSNGLTVISRLQPSQPFQICEMNKHASNEVNEANAKLIAASPILYNAAYSALQAIYAMPKKKQAFYKYLINDLLNAIQKANGTII